MFRESDLPDKVARLHRSFTDKPVPLQQQISLSAKFDDEFDKERHKLAFYKESMPEPVPVTWDTIYDPNSPDADWNGLVQKRAQKKHVQGVKAQHIGITHSEFGIVGEMPKLPARLAGVNLRRSDTESLIAGIDAPTDPYRTSTQSQFGFEPTQIAQLTLARRSVPKPKALAETYNPNLSLSNTCKTKGNFESMYFSGQENIGILSRSICGYNNTMNDMIGGPSSSKIGSMLSNIGASIFQRVPDYREIQVQIETKGGATTKKQRTTLTADYKRSNIRFG